MATLHPPPSAAAMQSASLYVGDLHADVTEADLFDLFQTVGPVASVRICRDTMTRRSLGYGYVNFHNATDAERALDTLNFKVLRGRPCRVMWSQRDPSLRRSGVGNVFVNNLPPTADSKALFDKFSDFGDILSCKVPTDYTGAPRGYGFVHFQDGPSATAAIEQLNGTEWDGVKVVVQPFIRKSARHNEWTNCYVKHFPASWDEARLRELFEPFGRVSSCAVMRGDDGESRGFGFVNFEEHDAAESAVNELHGKQVEVSAEEAASAKRVQEAEDKREREARGETEEEAGEEEEGEKEGEDGKEAGETETSESGHPVVTLYVARAQKKAEREREQARLRRQAAKDAMEQYKGRNLYIKRLDDSVDEDALRSAFSKFGTITSCRIMREANGRSKGFGFVCFSDPEEATKAVQGMHNQMLGAKPIYVALAMSRHHRQAQLERDRAARMVQMAPVYGNVPGMYPMMPRGGAQFMMPQAGMMMPRGPMAFPRGPMPMAPGAAGHPTGPGGFPPQMFHMGQHARMPGAPAAAAGMGMGVGGGAGNRRGGSGRRQMHPHPHHPHQQQQQHRGSPAYHITPAARNFHGQGSPVGAAASVSEGAAAPAPAAPSNGSVGGVTALTAEALAGASVEERKNMIGERLYPLIHAKQPELAGKITGMLLEMDNSELLNLLDSDDALTEKIGEALEVLRQHNMA